MKSIEERTTKFKPTKTKGTHPLPKTYKSRIIALMFVLRASVNDEYREQLSFF